MGLRWPYLEAVNLSIIFTRDDEKTEDRAKVSMSPPFEGLLINSTELQDILTKIKCMAMLKWLKIRRQNYELKDMYGTRLLENFSPLQNVDVKVTPIERQSF